MAFPSTSGDSATPVELERNCSPIESPHLPFPILTTPWSWRFTAVRTTNCFSPFQRRRPQRSLAISGESPSAASEKSALHAASTWSPVMAVRCPWKHSDTTTFPKSRIYRDRGHASVIPYRPITGPGRITIGVTSERCGELIRLFHLSAFSQGSLPTAFHLLLYRFSDLYPYY